MQHTLSDLCVTVTIAKVRKMIENKADIAKAVRISISPIILFEESFVGAKGLCQLHMDTRYINR